MPHPAFLFEVVVLLIAAVVCVPLFERLRLGAVLGYLVAGVAIGPGALGLISDLTAIQAIAELGVVFLLFTIGLEFTREQLRLINSRVYALAVLQIVVTAATIAGVARLIGFAWPPAVIVGGALALSSTAIVLPVLVSLGKMNTKGGRIVTAVLLIQDLAVGPILVLIATLGNNEGPFLPQLGLAVIKAAVAIAAILAVGRLVLRPALRIVARARSPEVFVGMALLIALGTALATESAGLSMAFGGFLAGLMLSETEFRHQIAADVEPFRGLLLGLFFLSIGMAVDLSLLLGRFDLIVGLAIALMVGKAALAAGIARALGFARRRSIRTGAVLAQGGEFAFVSFSAAAAAGLIETMDARLLFAVVTLTMIVTPVAIEGGNRLTRWLETRGLVRSAEIMGDRINVSRHVIVVGYGEIGQIVTRMLKAYGVPYVVLELSPERVREGRHGNEPVYFGDATRAEVLKGAGAADALAVVATTATPGVAEGLAALRRHTFLDLNILVRGGGEQATMLLRRAGLTPVGQEATDTGLRLTGAVLELWHAAETDPEADAKTDADADADAGAGAGESSAATKP